MHLLSHLRCEGKLPAFLGKKELSHIHGESEEPHTTSSDTLRLVLVPLINPRNPSASDPGYGQDGKACREDYNPGYVKAYLIDDKFK